MLIELPAHGIIYVENTFKPKFESYLKSLGLNFLNVRPGREKKAEQDSDNNLVISSSYNFCKYARDRVIAAFVSKNREKALRPVFPLMSKYVTEDGEILKLVYSLDYTDNPRFADYLTCSASPSSGRDAHEGIELSSNDQGLEDSSCLVWNVDLVVSSAVQMIHNETSKF